MKKIFHMNREIRVIAEGEGWSMVRRKGCMPFVVRTKELSDYPIYECPKCGIRLEEDGWCKQHVLPSVRRIETYSEPEKDKTDGN